MDHSRTVHDNVDVWRQLMRYCTSSCKYETWEKVVQALNLLSICLVQQNIQENEILLNLCQVSAYCILGHHSYSSDTKVDTIYEIELYDD